MILLLASPALARIAPLSSQQVYAYAEELAFEAEEYSLYGVPLTTMDEVHREGNIGRLFTNSNTEQRGDAYVIVSTDWTWRDITEAKTPSLYSLVYANASANMIYTGAFDTRDYQTNPAMHILLLSDASVSDLEEVVGRVMRFLKHDDSLVVTNSVSFIGEWNPEDYYTCVIIKDASDKGLFTCDTTQRMGLITTKDAQNAFTALAGNTQRFPAALTLFPTTYLMPTITRLDILSHDYALASALQISQASFLIVFVGILLFALLLSAVLLFLEMRMRPRFLTYLLPFARLLWIGVLSIPLACSLMMIQLPTVPDAEICLDYFWFAVAEIALVCVVLALVFRWSFAFAAILGCTVFILVGDQLVGAPLACGSYLSYAPVEGVRFFGIGNEGAALLYGAWMVLIAFYLNGHPDTKLANTLRSWLFPVLTAVVMLIIAAPWWGANFGVIIWGTVGTYVAWRRFNEHRLRKREVAGVVAASGLLAVVVLFLDTTFNGDSHMGAQVDFGSGDALHEVANLFVSVAQYGWDTITFMPVLSVGFVIIVAFLFFLDVKKPGPYAQFWKDNQSLLAVFNALLITSVLMFFVEDSGILMPALLLLYPLAGLVWFVCDYHSLHIRSFLHKHRAVER